MDAGTCGLGVLLAGLDDTDSESGEGGETGDKSEDATDLDGEDDDDKDGAEDSVSMPAAREVAQGDVAGLKKQRLTAVRAGSTGQEGEGMASSHVESTRRDSRKRAASSEPTRERQCITALRAEGARRAARHPQPALSATMAQHSQGGAIRDPLVDNEQGMGFHISSTRATAARTDQGLAQR